MPAAHRSKYKIIDSTIHQTEVHFECPGSRTIGNKGSPYGRGVLLKRAPHLGQIQTMLCCWAFLYRTYPLGPLSCMGPSSSLISSWVACAHRTPGHRQNWLCLCENCGGIWPYMHDTYENHIQVDGCRVREDHSEGHSENFCRISSSF